MDPPANCENELLGFLSGCVWIVRIKVNTDSDDGDYDSDDGDSDSESGSDPESGFGSKSGSDSKFDDVDNVCDSDSDSDNDEEIGEEGRVVSLSGFAVASAGNCGYLLTCAHGRWHNKRYKITVRPLGGEVSYVAEVVAYNANCDVCLLKVRAKIDNVVTFGSGNVEIGERIHLICNSSYLLGTLVSGNASYGCTQDVNFDINDQRVCRKFRHSAWRKPAYRMMGHIWNAERFDELNADAKDLLDLEPNYLSRLPILHCSNIVGGPGASGGPLFNGKGQLVGMLIGGFDGYQIGVHVTALQQFVDVSPLGRKKKMKLKKKRKLSN